MNILLATYNFYPYRSGGSEVYVYTLAKYLLSLGFYPTIVAAIPPEVKPNHEEIIYQDENLEIFQYLYDGIKVWSGKYCSFNMQQNYSKKSSHHKNSWKKFFKEKNYFNLLHIHGFTHFIGLDLFQTLKEICPSIKVICSYHTPISCTKNNLIFANKKRECPYKIGVTTCTACFVSERLNVPYNISKVLAHLLPNFKIPQLPASISLKSFVSDSIQSFIELDKITDRWIIYSNGIKDHLIRNKIRSNKIFQLKHGISNLFFENYKVLKSENYTNFLFNGRLDKAKGFHTLLKSWLKIPETDKRMLLITAHPTSANVAIQKLINVALLRSDIKFLGSKTQLDLLSFYRQAHCVIIPSEVVEIGPLVFHEAISAGCNIIASDIGGCAELGNYYKAESILFRAGDSSSLLNCILKFKYKCGEKKHPILTSDLHNSMVVEQYKEFVKDVI